MCTELNTYLLFYFQNETLSDEGPLMTSFASTKTLTVGNNMEMTGQINYDQQRHNYSEPLVDEIVGCPSGPTLEFVPADVSKEQSTVPPTDDYSVLQIGIPEKEPDQELTNIEVEFTIPETSTVSNAQEQTIKNTEGGLTTPEMYTASNAQVNADSTNSTIVGYCKSSGSKNIKPQKGRKRKCKTDKIYIDYLSDEDYSTFIDCEEAAISDEWFGSTSDDDDVVTAKTKRSKKTKSKKQNTTFDDISQETVGEEGLRNKRINSRKERSQKRMAGQEYVRSDGKIIESKSIQPNPCIGKKCGNNCENIDTEKRQKVFDHFWELSGDRRRDWLVSITQKEEIKRKRVDSGKRSASFKYHINEGEGRRPVCLQFLSATLNISSKSIYHTVKNSSWGCAKDDLRGKHLPPNKTKPATIESASNFIKSLPAVPSHYCRHDSTRVYLSHEYKNVANLYCAYKKRSEDNGVDFVSEKVFRKIFTDDFNIGFHVPKKDKCIKCLKYASDPAKTKEKTDHELEKTESYNRFFTHKNIRKSDPNTLCVSFDLEKVLNTPHGESMLLYYSRKLAVYNLCFYENGTRKVFCYYWDESDGKRGANEISSILHRYILSVDERGNVKNLLLYCDCCPGQNRNRVVLAMIHSTLQQCKNLETIQINYLLTGHTYMPVDSVHAVIETNLKKTIIYAPSQWYTVFTTARKDPFPYEVQKLTFEDFYKWDCISEKYFKGNLTGKISKIRIATFKKSNISKVSVKYSMDKSAKSSVVEIQYKTRVPLMSCYRSRLPIAKAKYDDLVKLCKDKVIPDQFQKEFTDIPCSASAKDTLPESDIEDMDRDNS